MTNTENIEYNEFLMRKWLILLFLGLVFLPSIAFATISLDDVNQKVCGRFEADASKLAAIMDEVRSRNGITETRVAFGGSDTPIKSADYWINFAAEAIAYQRVQKFSSASQLKSNLEVLKGKILKAKTQVGLALNSNE